VGPENNLNGWKEWSNYVLKELERLNGCYIRLDSKIDILTKEVVILKVKAGVWEMIGGAIPVLLALGIYFLETKM